MRASRSCSAARAASVCCVRSPKPWLGLLSTMTTSTEVSGSRSSRVSDGLASASTMQASAAMRIAAPRLRTKISSPAITSATASAIHSTVDRDERSECNTETQDRCSYWPSRSSSAGTWT